MSDYNLLAGVDENYNFPPEVLAALIESLNIRSIGEPMTTAERNALDAPSLDSGYYIFNTDTQVFQVWRADPLNEWHDGLEAPGTVKEWAGNVIPAGWKKQDGTSLPRAKYKALFDKIGTTYGGSGTPTHFNLPNRGGRVSMDTSSAHHLGKQGGAETVALSVAQLPSHNHGGATTVESQSHEHRFVTGGESARHYHLPFGDSAYYMLDGVQGNGPQRYLDLTDGGNFYRSDSGSSTGWNQGDHSHAGSTREESVDHTHGIYAQGGDGFHENMQPYHTSHLIIKY